MCRGILLGVINFAYAILDCTRVFLELLKRLMKLCPVSKVLQLVEYT